jgi:hypothetical protein
MQSDNRVDGYRSLKSYYRRWILGLMLTPEYVFLSRSDVKSNSIRVNRVVQFFDKQQILNEGFDAWWNRNSVRVQMPCVYLAPPEIALPSYPIVFSTDDILKYVRKEIEQKRKEVRLDTYISNLTIIDTSDRDHKPRSDIDLLLNCLLLDALINKNLQRDGGRNSLREFGDGSRKKLAPILDVSLSEKDPSYVQKYVSEKTNRAKEVMKAALHGWFFVEPGNRSDRLHAEVYAAHSRLWSVELESEFRNFSSKEFFDLDYFIRVLCCLAPQTLSKNMLESKEGISVIPSYDDIIKRGYFLHLPDQADDEVFFTGPVWQRISRELDALFDRKSVKNRERAADQIGRIFLEETDEGSTPSTIDQDLLQMISSLLPYLYSEVRGDGSLDSLWKKRPGLFVKTTDYVFSDRPTYLLAPV